MLAMLRQPRDIFRFLSIHLCLHQGYYVQLYIVSYGATLIVSKLLLQCFSDIFVEERVRVTFSRAAQ